MRLGETQFVRQYTPILKGPGRERFVALAYMKHRPGGLWEARLVFLSLKTGAAIATDRETTQGKREHVLYWATGLGPTYLRGALERALRRQAGANGARRRDSSAKPSRSSVGPTRLRRVGGRRLIAA